MAYVVKIAVAMAAMPLFGALARPSSSVCLKKQNDTQLLPSYDYVVVGAGASGLTVANRLSEDPNVTVLVIEAGELDAGEDFVKIPGLAGGAVGTKYDWNTTYVANDALGGRVVSIPQGKIVGGSTKLNRMVFDRGSKSDYDRWESLGASGWNWDTLLPYFKKNEKFTPPTPEIVAEWEFMIDAIRELGITVAKDQANGSPIGGYFCPHNQDPKTATRSSAREAYYDNFTGRQNLHLLTGRQVTKVVTAGSGNSIVATGVASNATFAAEARAQYDGQQNGPLSSPTGDFIAFLPLSTYSKAGQTLSSQATAQDGTTFLPSGTPAEVVKGYQAQHKVLNDRLLADDSALLEIIWADGAMVLGLQHPYSRGNLKAASSSTFDAPVADSAFLKNPLDVSFLVEAVKFTRTLTGTDSIKGLQPFEIVPGANVTTDDAIADFVRQQSSTLFHPVGTCKLGAREEGGVVDTSLKVYGISGLRVVDASIMPLVPATHIMTTVYAVAEKAADIIRGKTA
ncbi:GMC oxidoreductase [Colletotrichum tofieldiae]|nr:GMC oxidoreductase [Colletotrichum tofieldiae]